MVQHEYGQPEILRLENTEWPAPGEDEVLVRVRAVYRHVDLVALKKLIEWGEIEPVGRRACPLAETAAALDYVDQRHSRGKTVVAV